MSKKHVYTLAALLAAIGLGITLFRIFVLEFPVAPKETVETWRIETKIQFEALNGPVRVELQLPQNAPGLTVISRNFVTSGYGLRTRSPDINRQAVFTRRAAEGRQVLYYRAVIRKSRTRETPEDAGEPVLQRSGYKGTELAAARSIVAQIEDTSSDDRAFHALVWSRLLNATTGGEEQLLLGQSPSRSRMASVAVRLLGLANIPARAVHGLKLIPDRRNASFSHWTEIYDTDARKWVPFDPDRGVAAIPLETLTWWRGRAPFVRLVGGDALQTDVAVSRTFVFSLGAALEQQKALSSRLIDFSVFGLPIQTQEVFRILFVLPLGILLLVLLRNVVGLKTIGTFMPVLVALGFRETGILWGIVLFLIVVACGFAVRAYMEQLKLLMVPRLATVATVVIVIMAVLSVISFRLGIDRGLSVSLFPIIILTMAIERMSTVWEERGAKEATLQMGGTLVAAVLAFALMNVSYIEHFMFVFPESMLIVLAAMVLLGRYSGYRLVELPRFRILAGRQK